MDDRAGVLIAIVLGILLIAVLVTTIIPEPPQRAVIATERLDIAVLRFSNGSSWPGVEETLRARIENKLVNTPGITVFSRTRLDELLTEQALGETGLADPSTAARIGSLTGASKLITGTVYGIETRSEETTVCGEWRGFQCMRQDPATKYTAKVLAQIGVLNPQTGQIERSYDVSGSDSVTVKEGDAFLSYDTLIAQGTDDIASDVASLLTASYTRELRYGLYRGYKTKRDGYVGIDETSSFAQSDETATLVVHFTHARKDDAFELAWIDPQGNVVEKIEDTVETKKWRLYQLDLTGLPNGQFTIEATLDGTAAFKKTFILRD